MKSIRAKITVMTVCAMIIAITATIIVGVTAIRSIGSKNSEQLLLLMCETGEKNLDAYFESVEKSVEEVSAFIKADIELTDPDSFGDHMARAKAVFEKTAYRTSGVMTYYYRIDPEFSDTEKGFWYIDLDGEGFKEHEVTDITLYDTADTSSLVWFTVPKYTGNAIWLPPYITENLGVRVISYNVPIYRSGVFVGVVGIEIDYTTMANQVDNIKLYDNGYAFINDGEGNIIYHPRIDVTSLADEDKPKVPSGLLGERAFVTYVYEGVLKQAAWMPLRNGMRLNVSVPVLEINGDWQYTIYIIVFISSVLLFAFIIIALRLTGHITKPLRDLTEAAEQLDKGNYDVKLDYQKDDEVGALTRTVSRLIDHLKGYISDLNSLAYGDALTSVRNKGAFDIFIREIQANLEKSEHPPEFAVGIFDCDNLKTVNDTYGHDKGDMYLKNSSHLICRVFHFSPVFRIGGDEFAVILQNDDFEHRDELAKYFVEKSAEICAFANAPWEQIRVAMGIAVYDPATDRSVEDVIHRADKLMYENKKMRKSKPDNK